MCILQILAHFWECTFHIAYTSKCMQKVQLNLLGDFQLILHNSLVILYVYTTRLKNVQYAHDPWFFEVRCLGALVVFVVVSLSGFRWFGCCFFSRSQVLWSLLCHFVKIHVLFRSLLSLRPESSALFGVIVFCQD